VVAGRNAGDVATGAVQQQIQSVVCDDVRLCALVVDGLAQGIG
jgi:hypothetical protein